jgi:hypothetical protein
MLRVEIAACLLVVALGGVVLAVIWPVEAHIFDARPLSFAETAIAYSAALWAAALVILTALLMAGLLRAALQWLLVQPLKWGRAWVHLLLSRRLRAPTRA